MIVKSAFKNNIVVLGCGNVVEDRILLALRSLAREGEIGHVTYCDVLPTAPFKLIETNQFETYLPMEGKEIPLKALNERGFVGANTILLVCTPTSFHGKYALDAFGRFGRIAVEKPLTLDPIEARGLLRFSDSVYAIGHQMHKKSMLDLIDRFAQKITLIENIARIEFDLFETKGVGQRQIDPALWDLGFHGLECILAPLTVQSTSTRFQIESVFEGHYTSDEGDASQSTVARIDGWVHSEDRLIPFLIRVGKGQPENEKSLRFLSADGTLIDGADLNESGYAAHERIIQELLKPAPKMGLALTEVVHVVESCHHAAQISIPMGTHPMGEAPAWLSTHELPVT
ncbi:hypothetical protein [Gimesia maris]|uniref:hypothetical protein n=1 Tax=Gimesia maris TaxID=122 RepID=UPI0032EA9AFF